MKSVSFYCLVTIFCLSAFGLTAAAQRTSNNTVHIGLDQQISCYRYPSGGLDLNAGMYLLHSYWKAGLSATDYNAMVGEGGIDDDYFDHTHFTAYGDWMYRLVGTYGRNLNLYAGGGIFLGCNYYELFKKLPSGVTADFPEKEFIYGIKPSIELEIYFCRKVAFTLGANFPFTFSSSLETDIAHVVGSLGLRVCL